MDKTQKLKLAMIALVVVALAVVVLGIWSSVKGPGAGPDISTQPIGEPVSPATLVSEDMKVRVPANTGKHVVDATGKADPYKWTVDTYPGKVFYVEYKCLATGRTWLFGKDGQIRSPFYVPRR